MGRLKLAVMGGTAYADRLAGYIQKNGPEYLEVSRCRNSEDLSGFLEDIQPDILLYEQENDVSGKTSGHMVKILLSDGGEKRNPMDAAVFRYQQGAEILRQIFHIYGQNAQKDISCWHQTDELKMDAVYAPGGHELQIPFSIAYASLCGKQAKTLYLNLSEFSGMVPLFGEKEGENISDLVYGIRQKKDRFPYFLQSVLHHAENFDYIQPSGNPKDLFEIQEEDLIDLLSLLTDQTDYQYIIWNIGILNQLAGQILKYCNRIFCVVKENSFGKYRKVEFERFLEKEEGKQLKQKMHFVSPQTGNTGLFSQAPDMLAQLQSGEFAEQVEKLAKERDI